MLSFEQARQSVIEVVSARRRAPATEYAAVREALGRVLAAPIHADRDYPPFDRTTRDGFAVRAADLASPGTTLECVGEIKAGDTFTGAIARGQCVQIMTGAAVPPCADAVVMIEYTKTAGRRVSFDRSPEPGQNIMPRGSEARAGQSLLAAGARMGFAELALATQVGQHTVPVTRRPRVAILSTGDEVVDVQQTPGAFQIRNSNSVSLGAQAVLAGAEPVPLGNAADRPDDLRSKIEAGLACDVLVLSGGVSMGKYDLVEGVLRELGAEFVFDAVAIRPGRPAVFAVCRGKMVFGLPGNPVSTMVTFELFVLPALDLLSGAPPRPLAFSRARLRHPVQQKAALAHFLPARVAWKADGPEVEELSWRGSGDIVSMSQANCFLVLSPDKLELAAGEWATILPRRDAF